MKKQHSHNKMLTEQEKFLIMEKLLKQDLSQDPALIRRAREAKEMLRKYPVKKD